MLRPMSDLLALRRTYIQMSRPPRRRRATPLLAECMTSHVMPAPLRSCRTSRTLARRAPPSPSCVSSTRTPRSHFSIVSMTSRIAEVTTAHTHVGGGSCSSQRRTLRHAKVGSDERPTRVSRRGSAVVDDVASSYRPFVSIRSPTRDGRTGVSYFHHRGTRARPSPRRRGRRRSTRKPGGRRRPPPSRARQPRPPRALCLARAPLQGRRVAPRRRTPSRSTSRRGSTRSGTRPRPRSGARASRQRSPRRPRGRGGRRIA